MPRANMNKVENLIGNATTASKVMYWGLNSEWGHFYLQIL